MAAAATAPATAVGSTCFTELQEGGRRVESRRGKAEPRQRLPTAEILRAFVVTLGH